MDEGRSRAAWAHTSAVLAMLAEVNRDRKKKASPFRPGDFDPWALQDRKDKPAPKVGIEALKIFIKGS